MFRRTSLVATMLALAIGAESSCSGDRENPSIAAVNAASGTGGGGAPTSMSAPTAASSSSSGNSSSSQGGGGAAPDCGGLPATFSLQGPKCAACLDASCCAKAKACDAGTDCFMLLQCESECMKDPTCIADCESKTPAGKSALAVFDHCLDVVCGVECGVDVICDANLQAGDEECATCLSYADPTGCCAEFEAFDCDSDKTMCSKEIDAFDACANDPMSAVCTGDPIAKAAYACLASRCPICGG